MSLCYWWRPVARDRGVGRDHVRSNPLCSQPPSSKPSHGVSWLLPSLGPAKPDVFLLFEIMAHRGHRSSDDALFGATRRPGSRSGTSQRALIAHSLADHTYMI
jgi:hypothetical protein